ESVPALRLVIVGRSRLSRPAQVLELGPLDTEAASSCLESLDVPADLARSIVAMIGGNPLALLLAAEVVRGSRSRPDELRDSIDQLFKARPPEELIQGILYQRILSHIHDPEVRKLVHPGLVLRRITPELITEVLAGPCS